MKKKNMLETTTFDVVGELQKSSQRSRQLRLKIRIPADLAKKIPKSLSPTVRMLKIAELMKTV